MSINKLSAEQEAILKLLSNYGCVDMSQLYAMYDQIDPNDVDMFVRWLIKMKRVDLQDGRFLTLHESKGAFSQNALSCIWTMIKLSNSRNDVIGSFKASDPAFAYMTVDNKDAYVLVPVTAVDSIKIRAIQEKVAKEHKSRHFRATYVFVSSDPEVRERIKEADFPDDVYMALLTYDKETKIPSIKLLKKAGSDPKKVSKKAQE